MLNLYLAAILLPLIGITLLFRRPRKPTGGWVATLILAAGLTAFSYFVMPWGYLGLPFRYVLPALFVLALVISLRRPIDDRADDTPTRMLVKVLIAFFFGNVAIGVARARSVPPNPIDLAFPLRGNHVVIHGGSTPAANTYVGRGAESFAVDVTATPGETVFAPCDGTLTAPVKLQCGDVTVELRGVTSTAKQVRQGEPMGQVKERQVHIHAERGGTPVPMTFRGRWVVRNDSL